MRKTKSIIPFLLAAFILFCPAVSMALGDSEPVEVARYEQEYSDARVEPAQMEGKAGLAVVFDGTSDLHF